MPLLCVAVCLLVAWLVPAAHADVFMRIGNRAERVLEQAGGRSVYQTDVSINGQPASLTLLGFDRSPGEVGPQLAQRLGLPVPSAGEADGAHLTGVRKTRALNVILLPGSRPDTTLAMLVDQRAANASRAADQDMRWPDLPHPVDAMPTFTAVNAATRTTLAVANAAAAPEALHAEMLTRLQADGWQPAAPRARNGSLALYNRGGAMLLVYTQSAPENNQTRITLLQRLGHAP